MNIDLDTNTIIIIVVVLFALYYIYTEKSKKKENWTLLAGAPQEWRYDLPRNPTRCDTGYNDEACKFSAINCLNNPHSYFYEGQETDSENQQ
jgi:hypothetical protein